MPMRGVFDGPREHPVGERSQEAGTFRQRNEEVRSENAAGRVTPTDQRFDAGHVATRDLGLGLVVEYEFVVVDSAAQLAEHLELTDIVGIVGLVVSSNSDAGSLGAIHGD